MPGKSRGTCPSNETIGSLGATDADVAPHWADEIAARVRAVMDGSAVLQQSSVVLAELDRELAELHG